MPTFRVHPHSNSLMQVMVVIGVLYIDVVGAAGSWRWLSVSCIALCVLWDGGIPIPSHKQI